MKRNILLTIFMLIATLSLSAEIVDTIVAKVGREIILKSDLERQYLQMQQMEMLEQGITKQDVLNDMVESLLILQTARERDYRLDEHRIRQMIDSQISSQIERFGSETAMRNELRKTGMTMSDLRNYLDSMIREQRLKEMIIQNEITNRIHITESELREYYEEVIADLPLRKEMIEVWMLHLEVKASEETKKQALDEANRIYSKIREGQDFAQLARELSDCPSASLGGDLGFFGRGAMIREFEEIAFSLKPGETSSIVETQFGYHIIKMEERDHDDIRVRHILKMTEPTEEDVTATMRLTEELLDRLRSGEDYREIAGEYSSEINENRDGIIGEFREDNMPEMFSHVLDGIEVGEYSEPFKQDNDIYVFGKTRRIPERRYTLTEIREELKEYLVTVRQVEHYERWIENLVSQSYVEVLMD